MAQIALNKNGTILYLKCEYHEKSKAKRIGGKWNPKFKCWQYPFDLLLLEKMFESFDDDIIIPDKLEEYVERKQQELNQINKIKEEAKLNTPTDFMVPELWFKDSDISNPLYNYQRHGVRYGSVARGGFMIADDMGLGKSVQGLGISLVKKREGAKRCLIVCPASLKYNWLNEVEKFTHEKAIVIDGDVQERVEKWFDESCYFKIVNYEIFTRDLYCPTSKEAEKRGREVKDARIPGYETILDNWFDIVVVDEIHGIKSHKSYRSKALKKLKVHTRVGLTGTPIDGKLEELHSVYDFLVPGLFPGKMEFMKRHAIYDYFGGIEGYKHIDEVKETISPYFIRRLKKNVLTDLPDKIFQDIYVELDKKIMKEYKELAKRKHEITKEDEALVAIIRCRQFCDFPQILDLDMPSEKFKRLNEILEELVLENKQKVIIFSQFRQSTDIIFEKLQKKYNVLYLHGDVSPKMRVEMCNQFNNLPESQIIVMTEAGSTGLNLTGASYVIHYTDNYSPSIMQQRSDRAHRIGQKNTVNVIRFICKDTVEERVRKILDKKLNINSKMLDEDYSEMSLGSFSSRELLKLL